MISSVSTPTVMLFGAVVLVLSAWGIAAPKRLIDLVRGVMDRDLGIYVAIIARVVLGLALLGAAQQSSFPQTFRVLGWIAIIAAVGLAIIGRDRVRRFVARFERLPAGFIRLWLIFGIAFGGFLIYGLA